MRTSEETIAYDNIFQLHTSMICNLSSCNFNN